jgi:hypothetical protein
MIKKSESHIQTRKRKKFSYLIEKTQYGAEIPDFQENETLEVCMKCV